ncbi:TonB-dependent siderophore receptor [Thauera linaloolentis]|uniref:TonB-dependent siderophore receptor n=1 Tax=Thauera linaloolentis (strain DSM 12138 / JCM 21573 / CCUG 41526 / CIP 105981 / IAM 15112 / NBRC 102519 / 47Lol) TaxID=1123367 RepID=N6YG35_THAL4|nr:TonB-dependent siderophore receptor [Thauera linaloolentis]ENO90460.1 TonB-dependent siderophore receptor [Thauera linaloolentis 47Lol = DSM 12138]MCM8566320.1 TonB-dependent siderophore receptor [Thauera linaloolentis]
MNTVRPFHPSHHQSRPLRPAAPDHAAAFRLHALALGCVIALGTLAIAPPAHAQQNGGTEARAVLAFDQPAQPLGEAINALARHARVQIVFAASATEGFTAPALRGSYTPRQALDRLLAGSGLVATHAGGSFIIQTRPHAPEATLKAVTVSAQHDRSGTTEGTGSYTQRGPSGTATGLALSLRETPQSVSVMTRQRMDDFKLETLTDVLEQAPGVTVSRQNDMTTFNVRGATVNLQTDGARRTSAGWGWNTHIVHTLDDLAEIDRVEVLKGSSGLINGDGAYGATVNLIRKRPTREFQASVTAGAGSWDNYRLDTDVGGPLNADASLRGRLVAAHKESKTFNGKETDSSMLYGTLEYDLGPDTLASAGLTWRQREQRGAGGTTPIQGFDGNGNAVPRMARDYNIGAPWAGYEQDSLNAFARLEHRFANGWTGKLQITHDGIETPKMHIGSLRYALPAVTGQFGLYKDIESRDQSLIVDLQGPFQLFGREHKLLLGAGASRSRTTLLRGGPPDAALPPGVEYAQGGSVIPQPDDALSTYSNDKFSSKRRYLYAASQLSLADPVKLIVGTRVSNYEQKDVTDIGWYNYDLNEKGVVTPYAGLVVDVARDISVYASYASIYQVQSAKDANERTLDPEEGLTYEVGAKGEFFDKRLNASASYFWMRTDNTAEEIGLNDRGDSIYRAVMGTIRRGYELELSGELARGWQAQGSYVQNSSDLDSSSATPKHQFKLGSTWQFTGGALRGLTVGAATRWQSAISVQRGNARLGQDAYWLLDLMARYQIDERLSISANLNNALDKKYFAGVTNFNAQGLFYTWGAPRSFTASLRYDF